MSQFGADIFDDEPPTKPPTRKGRKSSPPKASEPVASEPETAPASEPKKRPSRRKKAAATDAEPSMATPQVAEDAIAQETSSLQSAEPKPQAESQPSADDQPKQRSRVRGRRSKRVDVAAQDVDESPQAPEPRLPQAQPVPQAPAAQRAEPPAPTEAEFDDEGEGFGALPEEESVPGEGFETNQGGQSRDDGNFPRFGEERRGRRRRRRRGRRGNRDDGANGRPAQGQEQDGNAFHRDPHAEEQRPQSERGGFPRDPASPDADRRDERRDDRNRHEPSRHSHGRHGHGRDDSGRREHGRNEHGRDFDHDEDQQPRTPRRPYTDFKPATPPPTAPQPRRIAVLVDLAQLSEQAKSRGGEIAYRKLRAAIAGHDEVVHAVCFATRDLPETGRRVLKSQGFTIEDCADADACADAMSEEASRAQWPVDALVVVGSRRGASLPQAAGGAAVETAGFDGNGATSPLDRCLPNACLFVP